MVLPWDPHWAQPLPMHFYVTMRKSDLENVLKNFYQMFTKDMLMTFL